VVNEEGQQLGVMPTDAARDIASRVGLDLVEISPNGTPPVCKIMDYGRYKYELKKKAATAKRSQHQSQLKEIKLRPQIDEHDLAFKLRAAERFLIEGDKVKATVTFRGADHASAGRSRPARSRREAAHGDRENSRRYMEEHMLSPIVAQTARRQESGAARGEREGATRPDAMIAADRGKTRCPFVLAALLPARTATNPNVEAAMLK
jgi:translation initiation factor IF-3